MTPGRYIVFEGLDGSGKTTQSQLLVERLKHAGFDAVWTREPGSPLIALNVRDLLLSKTKLDPLTLELLFEADRAEHTTKIRELLLAGKWVVSDRSFISGLCYGMACGNDFRMMTALMRLAIKALPDHVFHLGIPDDVWLKRKAEKNSDDREEAKGLLFAQAVRKNFEMILGWLSRKEMYGIAAVPFKKDETYLTLDGTRAAEALHEEIWRSLGV